MRTEGPKGERLKSGPLNALQLAFEHQKRAGLAVLRDGSGRQLTPEL